MVRRMLYLNGLAIFCVVLFHSVGMVFVAMFDWAPRLLADAPSKAALLASPSYWLMRVIEQLVAFSVPSFLFVSGFFVVAMAGRSRDHLQWNAVFTRIKKLLVPYLFWSIVAMLLIMVFDARIPSPTTILVNLLTGRANEVLYFVPLLIQYYLLSPILVRLARWNWLLLLVVTGVLQLFVQALPLFPLWGFDAGFFNRLAVFFPKWVFYSRLFWFSLGIVFGLNLEPAKALLMRIRWALLAFIVASIPIGIWEWEVYFRRPGEGWIATRETLIDTFYALAVILAFLAFANVKLPLIRWFESLGKDTFGIFLTHGFFVMYFAKFIYKLAPSLLRYDLLLIGLYFAVGLAGSLALMRLMRSSPARQLPVKNLYSYLFG